ncbi:MAG: HAMP domain-containing sensor histidine kinase [bacterium]
MEKGEKIQKEEAGDFGYVNENCWLAKNLNYPPYGRCQYCQSKFRNCLFLHYQTISLILVFFFFTLSFLIGGSISELVVISVFTLVIVYGYFFNKSTDKIIQANFTERKAKEALEKLSGRLEVKVGEQTKELRMAYEELKKLDQAKTEFVSMASHQLRTPLSAIKGYASMLFEGSYGKLEPKQEEKLKNILISNERLIGLVNDLLDISKMDLGKMELNTSVFQLEELVNDCCQEIMPLAKEKGLKFTWEKPVDLLPMIEADELKIKEVVSNLLDNSVQYTRTGKIIVKLEKISSSLKLSIKDTGEGVTKEDAEKLFQTFGRGTAGINTFIEGTGLGLMVAKRFVDLHNGKLWVESEGAGKGSTFYLELPITHTNK